MKLRKIESLKPKQKKLRVCAYARVSTDSLKQGESFENQVSTYERVIKSNPEYEFVSVYADQGMTGRSENRPEFQRMIADCKAGKIDLIITKSISRFARNTTTVLKYTRELKEIGVGVLFEENNINTLSSEGELMMTVLASFAQEESRSISENNKWTLKKKFERGEGMVNTARFMGYDKDETGDLVINKEEAKVVRLIFKMYLLGIGCHRIAKALNEEGVPTIAESSWHASTIKGMLTNEKYKGDFHIQKTYIPEGTHQSVKNNGQVQSYYVTEDHPAIISAEEWQQVQELMEYHRKQRNIGKGEKYQKRYPMSGMLVCPYCGKSLRRRYVYNRKVEWLGYSVDNVF
ncbi:recombinase family protein [Butyribacter intestini]|jgi:site-specific DNA recombinase|uniref:recombinase family protein n=1 Tax=Butyribacter intestini TaxID=1703332 RepID=UPI0022DF20AC|nr:recombinase family protein [Butyribacter intestini]